MGKTNKAPKSAPAAPAAPANVNANTNTPAVLDMTSFIKNVQSTSIEGLDPNRRVDLLRMLHETFRMDVNAPERYHMSPETVAKINEISAIGQIAAMACEVTYAKNPFAIRMSISQLEAIKEVGINVGVSIDAALLPAPNDDGTVEVPAAAVKVSEETATQIKEEEKLRNQNKELDPTKIESDEQLIEALKQIMVSRENTYQKINDALNFYQAYLKVQASKSENKDMLKALNETSRIDLLKNMAKLIGACPLVLSGVGRYMYSVTATTKSPISAFCAFRNTTKNRNTGVFALSDTEIAEYVRTLIEWTTDTKVAAEKDKIESLKKDLSILNGDKKNNAKAIEEVTERIATSEKNLAHFEEVIGYITSPSSEVPSSLIENYVAHDSVAMRIFKSITDSYYDDIKVKEMKQDTVRHNVEQYAGIVTNLFRDATAQLEDYSFANIAELEPIESTTNPVEKKDESKKAEA